MSQSNDKIAVCAVEWGLHVGCPDAWISKLFIGKSGGIGRLMLCSRLQRIEIETVTELDERIVILWQFFAYNGTLGNLSLTQKAASLVRHSLIMMKEGIWQIISQPMEARIFTP